MKLNILVGQQWTPSEQQVGFTYGQQPILLGKTQQLIPVEHPQLCA